MKYVSPPNEGVIHIGSDPRSAQAEKTFIVMGVARSGTSMVATALTAAGLYMGAHPNDVVQEDKQILSFLQAGQHAMLRTLIGYRNSQHAVWGFKIPNLHAYLTADHIRWFRNPHLIVIFRDPVAVAVRGALSEHYDTMEGLLASAHANVAVAAFIDRLKCPTLLLSYEKAITFPERTLQSLLSFCGIEANQELMARLVNVILPNNPAYLATANSRFNGFVEGVVDGKIYGWCQQMDSLVPVRLELYADGVSLASFPADRHRPDLADNGIGNGNHGFQFELSGFNLTPETTLTVRVRGRTIELTGSGRRLAALQTVRPAGQPTTQVSPTPVPASVPGSVAAR